MNHSTTTIVKETEDGELYIDLPQETMDAMGWDENTVLEWRVYDDGTITLGKANDNSNEA
jgi:bifunctional DNA-binding transcriptional regulator/antitoxin component of YhaV-PrlF toxin-antitoxin module